MTPGFKTCQFAQPGKVSSLKVQCNNVNKHMKKISLKNFLYNKIQFTGTSNSGY